MSVKPLIVIFRLQYNSWFDHTNSHLLSVLAQKSVVRQATTPAQARRYLTSNTRPHAIILADTVVTKPEYHEFHARLAEYATAGGTVIYAAPFSSSSLFPDLENTFTDVWGLPWIIAESSTRGAYTVNPFIKGFDTDGLVKQCLFRGLQVENVAFEDLVYLTTSLANKLKNGPPSSAGTYSTPAAFANVGHGRVGYIGDESFSNVRERATDELILAMCFWPGSRAPIAPGDGVPELCRTGLATPKDDIPPLASTSGATDQPDTGEEVPLPMPMPPVRPRGPRPRGPEVTARAEARKKGNGLFKQEEWEEAAERYRSAALLGGPQPVYLSNLAACLVKLELWELADSAASRALVYDPKHVKVLYRRALARRGLDRWRAALADIKWLLTIDESNAAALKEQADLQEGLDLMGSLEWPEDISISSRRDHVSMAAEDEPDSEDFAHSGNGIACRDYNTNETGCPDGKACRFKHAPDSKSVRDELGRNVCVYWLLGHCRFTGEGANCAYAHDATYLPERGWWTDTARVEHIRAEFDAAVKEEPLDLGVGQVEERILAEAFVPLPWRKDLWVIGIYEDPYGRSDGDSEDDHDHGSGCDDSEEDDGEADHATELTGADSEDDDDSLGYEYECDRDPEDEEERGELNQFGVTDADVEEMWEYGIKPWEDGAYAEMLRIRRILNSL